MDIEAITEYLTLAQAAKLTGLTPYRIRQLANERRLPAVMTPLERLIPREAVEVLAREQARRALLLFPTLVRDTL